MTKNAHDGKVFIWCRTKVICLAPIWFATNILKNRCDSLCVIKNLDKNDVLFLIKKRKKYGSRDALAPCQPCNSTLKKPVFHCQGAIAMKHRRSS